MTATCRNINRAVLMFVGLLMLVAIPGHQLFAVPQRGGTVIFGQTGEPSNLDAVDNISDQDEEIIKMVYENLVRFREQEGSLEIEAALATRWEQSADGLTWTFYLRRGVRFHDGTPFNSDAVLHYFERALGEPRTRKGWPLFGPLVESVEAPDAFTVRIRLKHPHAYFLNRLAHGGAGIGSPAAYARLGQGVTHAPVGTGPFKLVEWSRGTQIVLEANQDYWRGRPNLDRVIVRPVREASTRVLQLEAGQLHVVGHLPYEAIPRLERRPGLEVVSRMSNHANRIAMNTSKAPYDNRLVRQALNHAINTEEIAEYLYGGLAVPISGAVSPAVAGYTRMRGYPYDPERARALLAQAGYPNGFTTTLWTSDTGAVMKDLELSQTVQQYLAAVGVRVSIERMEWASLQQAARAPMAENRSELTLEKWPPSSGEATWMFNASLLRQFWPPAGGNRTFYDNPVFEEMLTKAVMSTETDARDRYLRAAQILLAEDTPFIYLVTPMAAWGSTTKLHDMVYSPLTLTFASEKTWLER